MKKILFTLLAATSLFASCSSDNDVINNENDNINTKKYTVNLNVKSAGFEVDKTTLRAEREMFGKLLEIRVYKESGGIYLHDVLTYDDLKSKFALDGSLPYSLELPEGNYHLAIIQSVYNNADDENKNRAINTQKASSNNFYSDIIEAGPLGIYYGRNLSNTDSYYQSLDISVPSSFSDTSKIVLQPMWSTISLIIEDPKTFKIPTDVNFANYIGIDILPAYANFSLSTKLATNNKFSHFTYPFNMKAIDEIRNLDTTYNKIIDISETSSANNNMTLVVNFYKLPEGGNYPVMTKKIDLKTQVKNGYNYKITGKLDDLLNNTNLGITFEPFNDEEINLPFK